MWVSCFLCGGLPDGEVVLQGLDHGVELQLERGICALCAVVLLELELPITIGVEQTLVAVAWQEPLLPFEWATTYVEPGDRRSDAR